MNIAIFSPNKNPYSETFIQAHKNGLSGQVFYYYGLYYNDIQLEAPAEKFNRISLLQRVQHKLGGWSITELRKQNLIASLKRHNIDVVLVEYGQHAHRLLDLFKSAKLPFVVHFHGHDATEHYILKNVNNYKQVFAHAAGVIAVSTVMKAHLLELGCPPEKLHYNVYGPRTEFATVSAKQSKAQFVSVGRFTNKKAPYYTVLAFAEVLKQYPDAKLVMAGDGKLLEACKNLATYLGVNRAVDFVGIVNAQQLKLLLTQSLAYVQHSITSASGDMEGTPLSILEASAAGLPVISTVHAGIPDVIIHNKTGLLCNEHDVTSMAEHMIVLLADHNKAVQMGKAAKANMQENYTLARHLAQLDGVLSAAAST